MIVNIFFSMTTEDNVI